MLDYDPRDDGTGGSVLLTTFTGKNGFGLEFQFDAIRIFERQQVSGVQTTRAGSSDRAIPPYDAPC
jgi:hypothetical protein